MELNTAKAISMLTLGLGSFVAGMAPSCISEESRRRHPVVISCLLCFGAGVLLSTSLVHMLPEAREKMPENSELMLCIGYFMIYLVDEIVHFFYNQRNNQHTDQNLFRTDEETRLLRHAREREDGDIREISCREAGNPGACHVEAMESLEPGSSGAIGLLCALFVHSLLEGLAIGLQENSTQVLLLLGAVSAHKYVVGFCLGAELSAGGRLCRTLVCVLIFSSGSVAGIALGAGLETLSALKDSAAVPIMQALAAGTLLYVTVGEVLPRERARWMARRGTGALQFLAVAAGFLVMYFCTKYLDYDGA